MFITIDKYEKKRKEKIYQNQLVNLAAPYQTVLQMAV